MLTSYTKHAGHLDISTARTKKQQQLTHAHRQHFEQLAKDKKPTIAKKIKQKENQGFGLQEQFKVGYLLIYLIKSRALFGNFLVMISKP